jgi:serine/threonine-protein kinase
MTDDLTSPHDQTPPPPVLSPTPPLSGPPAAEAPRTGAERYTRIRLYARGGIGQVWLARDEALGREVALKELRPETASHPAHRQRFLEEARVTGQLEHPGIVPVYELAADPADPRPFFAMRLVKGRTLSDAVGDYHEKRRRREAAPLELHVLLGAFVTVCNTVAFAHHRGVVHRDLKGPNVLLGDFGEVIVLDWGLAKRVGESESEGPAAAPSTTSGSTATAVGQVLGTPGYMAPEQAAGRVDRIDARTDVYGLGALLYEILTGQPPFRGSDVQDLLRRVREEEPPRPRRLNPDAPRPLEAVALKALAKDPARRYADAAELGRDVQRWLADEPVSACREPLTVRLARFARRHKPLAAGLAGLVVTAAVALAVSTVLVGRQKARAEANFQQALEAVDRFFVQVSEERLLNEPGMQPLRRDLLQTAQAFCQRFVDENADDPGRRADLARVLTMLARVTSETDESGKAVPLYERALGLYERLLRIDPDRLEFRRGQAQCHLGIGVASHTQDPARAEEAYRRAAVLFQELTEAAPEETAFSVRLALCHNNLAQLLLDAGRVDAEEEQQRALAIQKRLAERDPDNAEVAADLAGSLSNQATLLARQKRWDEALAVHAEALELRRRLADRFPRKYDYRDHLGQSLNNHGSLLEGRGRYEEALKYLLRCLREREKLARSNPGVPRFRDQLAWTHNNLANVYHRLGRRAERAEATRQAVELLAALYEDFPEEPSYHLGLARAELNGGYLCAAEEDHQAAVRWYDRAIRTAGDAAALLARDAYWGRAQSRLAQKDPQAALADYDQALARDDGAGRNQLRLERTEVLILLQDFRRAEAEADDLARAEGLSATACFDLAVLLCRCAAAEKAPRSGELHDRAVALLVRAGEMGHYKESANRARLRTDRYLQPVRSREEVRKLLAGP